MTHLVKVHVHAYDQESNVFTLCAFGFLEEDEKADPSYCRSAPDFDDFEVPEILMPLFAGSYNDPNEVVGRVLEILV